MRQTIFTDKQGNVIGEFAHNPVEGFKAGRRGLRIDVSTGFHAATYYKRPWVARTLIALGQFWLRNWKILFPVIATAAVALFVHVHAFFNSANAPAVALKTSVPAVGGSVAGHHPANDHGGAKAPEEKQKMDKLDMHD